MKTTVVGSYPVPAWLQAMPSLPALRDATLVVLKTQELAGIDLLSDGELGRYDVHHPETNGMIDAFVRPLQGVRQQLTRAELEDFQRDPRMGFRARPAGVVDGPLGAGHLDLVSAWRELKGLTASPLKFTVTSPYMLAQTLMDRHHADRRALCHALADILAAQVAEIDAPVLQLDEAHLTGHPEDADWAHTAMNRVLDAVRGKAAVHLCFGNYGGSRVQQGRLGDLLPFLNRLHVDHLVLELARRGPAELPILRDLRDDIGLGIGVIDIKDTQVESPREVAHRIEQAASILGAERIQWVHPDCGFWMLARSVADRKMRALVEGRDEFLGRRSARASERS